MDADLAKLKDVLKSHMNRLKEVVDSLIFFREKLLATETVVVELVNRVEKLESTVGKYTSDGVRIFDVPVGVSTSAVPSHLELDIKRQELPGLILQHPQWLRPFSIKVELEKTESDEEKIFVKRSSTGYLWVVRLKDGTEWAYFEQISRDRFDRLPLLQKIFHPIQACSNSNWTNAWVAEPVRLQPLQRGARWVVLELGKVLSESQTLN